MKNISIVFFLFLFLTSCKGQEKESVEKLWKETENLISKNLYQKAITKLNRIIGVNEKDANAYFIRGKLNVALKISDGCEDVKRASELGHKEAKMAYKQYCKGINDTDFEKRKNELEKMAKKFTDNPELLYNIGNMYFDSRKYQEAIEFYDKALKIDGNYSAAIFNKGVCLINLKNIAKGCELVQKSADLGYEQAIQTVGKCNKLTKK